MGNTIGMWRNVRPAKAIEVKHTIVKIWGIKSALICASVADKYLISFPLSVVLLFKNSFYCYFWIQLFINSINNKNNNKRRGHCWHLYCWVMASYLSVKRDYGLSVVLQTWPDISIISLRWRRCVGGLHTFASPASNFCLCSSSSLTSIILFL